MRPAGLAPPPDRPVTGARVPSVVLRLALVALGIGLSIVADRPNGLLAIAIGLSLAAALAPQYLLGWALIVLLALSQLAHHAELTWRFPVLLAGLHLVHVLGMLAAELPWRSWLDPAVLTGPLVRFLLIQLPTQAVAVVVLLVLAPGAHGHRPVTVAAFAVIGVLALAGLMVLLLAPRQAER